LPPHFLQAAASLAGERLPQGPVPSAATVAQCENAPTSSHASSPPDSKEPEAATKTRAAVVQQCQAPVHLVWRCLNCSRGDCSHEQVMDLYLSAQYAVQDGSNFGLRYLMDSLVAGAVPVMLWNRTYALYQHHFPCTCLLSSSTPSTAPPLYAFLPPACPISHPTPTPSFQFAPLAPMTHSMLPHAPTSQPGLLLGLSAVHWRARVHCQPCLVPFNMALVMAPRPFIPPHPRPPANPDSFSVYLPYIDVPEWTTVEHRLSKVIHMIPSLIYVDPSHVLSNVRDAVDIAIDHMVDLWRDRKARHEYPIPSTASEPGGAGTETKEDGRGKRLADATLSELSGGGRGELVRAFASKSDAVTGGRENDGKGEVSSGLESSGGGGADAGKEVRGEGAGGGSGGAGGASDVDFMAAVIIDEGLAAEVAARGQTDTWKALAEELRLDAASALALAMEEFEEVQSGSGGGGLRRWHHLMHAGGSMLHVLGWDRHAASARVHGMLHLLGYDHEPPKGILQGAADSAMSEAELVAAVRESAEQMATEELRILEAFAWRGVGLVAAALGEDGGGAQGGAEGRGEGGGEVGGEEGEKGGVKARMTRIGMVQGTLLNSASKIAPSTAEALRAAHARGVRVAIATGKARPAAMSALGAAGLVGSAGIFSDKSPGVFLQTLPTVKARPAAMSALGAAGLVGSAGIFSDKSPGVFLQGLRVYGKGGQVVHNALLPREVTQEGFEFALKHGKALIGFCGDRCVTLVDHPLVEALHTIYYEPRAEVMQSVHHIINETPIQQKLLFYDTPHGIDGFIRPFWSAATAGRATVTQAVPDMLEILPPGQSKGAGVRVLLDHLKLSAEQVMAIGDGENDLEMIEMVGWGVAMANGSEKTKAVAKATVASNDDDAAAHPAQVSFPTTPESGLRVSRSAGNVQESANGSSTASTPRSHKEMEALAYSSGQSLASVLNDPRLGKAGIYGTENAWTWITAQRPVEPVLEGPPPLPPEIQDFPMSEFQPYLQRMREPYGRFVDVQEHSTWELATGEAPGADVDSEGREERKGKGILASRSEGQGLAACLREIPPVYFDEHFALERKEIFDTVCPSPSIPANMLLQEKLSHYLDLVEVHLVKEISSRSDSFFEALEKLEDLNRGIVETCDRIRLLRGTVGMLDEDLLEGSRKLQATKVRRENLLQLHQKLKLVAFVHQAMATLKLLVSSGDCAGALDVMDDLRRLMEGQELAGLHCFRPLNDLLLSSSDAVNSLLTAEFVREAVHDAADVAPSAIVTSFNMQKSVPPAATLLSIVNLEREGMEEREARLREHLLPLVISLLRTSRLPAVLRAYRDAVNVDIKAAVKTVVGELLPLLFLQHAAAAAAAGGAPGGAGGEGGDAAADALNAPSLALKLRALAPPAFVHLLLAVFSAVQTRLVRAAAVRNVVSGIATAGAAAGAAATAAEPAVGYEAAAVAAAFASGAELVVAAEAAESKLLGRKGVGKGLGGGGAAGGVGGAAGSGEAAGGDVSSVTALATSKQLRADVLRENAEAVSDACEVAHGRWAKLLGVRAQVHPKLSLGDFVDMYAVTSDFIASTERVGGRLGYSIRGALQSQAKALVETHHSKE
ncbi:unnamed protein product, partial [Closterium sp. NIES-64]